MYLTQPYLYGTTNGSGWWQFRPNQQNTIGFVGFDWGSEPIVVTSFQAWIQWKTAVAMENCRAILFEQATPFPVLQDSVSKWRAIGMSVLVTQLASNLNQGGQVAVYNEQMDRFLPIPRTTWRRTTQFSSNPTIDMMAIWQMAAIALRNPDR